MAAGIGEEKQIALRLDLLRANESRIFGDQFEIAVSMPYGCTVFDRDGRNQTVDRRANGVSLSSTHSVNLSRKNESI